MSREYGKIRVLRADGVETITLFNPEKRNAIGPQMVTELLYALDDATKADDVRVIVVTGEGKAFCAGGDFMSSDGSKLDPRGDFADLVVALAHAQKPVVARVNGPAMGGGLGIVASCTFAIAASDAKLGTPEVDLGLFPMMIMAILARNVPRRRLVQMMLLGEKFDAAEGLRIGLLNEVVAPEELDAAVKRTVDALSSKSPSTLRLGLKAFAEQDDLDLLTALPILRAKLGEVLATDDAREGLMAFMQKRKPVWTGK